VSIQSELPSVAGHWLLGNIPAFRSQRLALMEQIRRECGDVGVMKLGPMKMLFVSSPKLAHEILVTRKADVDKGPIQNWPFSALMGNGILTSEDPLHKRQRAMMAPFFTPKEVSRYAGAMVEDTLQMLDECVKGAPVDLDEALLLLVMRTGGRTLLAVDLVGDLGDLGKHLGVAMRHVDELTSGMVPPLPLSVPTPHNRKVRHAIETLRARLLGIIEERRKTGAEGNDVLSMLIRARDEQREGMSDQQVLDEAITLFSAGYETAAKGLTWCFYLLGRHPEIQKQVAAELKSVLGDRPPTAADAPRLQLCMRVFKEALRLYPPGSVMVRRALKDFDLGGYRVRKGQHVAVSIFGIHRREDLYPEPEKFDPDRFLPEREKQLPPGGYIPFGLGPRTCIGNHFAMLHGQLVVATVFGRATLTLESQEPAVPEMRMTLRPKDHIWARFSPLQNG
jgi:cytochrome P450